MGERMNWEKALLIGAQCVVVVTLGVLVGLDPLKLGI